MLALRKLAALVDAPTDVPRRITTMYIKAFDAVSASCFVTPHSLKRLPSIKNPTSGAVVGKISTTTTVTTIGKRIFSNFETGLNCSILIALSFLVVKSFIIGGCIIGTSDIYEYAATAIGPIKSVCPSFPARKMDVGPSAPPIIDMAAAAAPLNPKIIARKYAAKIPICAAAPSKKLLGLAISGPKSVIAPTPKKISDGRILHSSSR